MLSDSDLTAMRETAEASLAGTAVIQTLTRTSDSGGGFTEGWASAGTVDCRIAPIRGDEREIGERISPDADYVITLPWDAAVTTDSRIVSNGGTFNVEAIRDRTWPVTKRVEVVKET